jgi:type II secretory pathway pseudopilin PulG
MQSLAITTNRGWSAARRGISLIEVLVVLVILVIGLLAIIRLFPQGFASLNFTANVTQANALAKREEDYARKLRENLPDAIASLDPNLGMVNTAILPVQFHTALPYTGAGADDPRYSGVNWNRRVIGEHVRIPPPTTGFGPAPGETVSLHRLLYAPIYSEDAMPPRSLGVMGYSGTPMQRVVFQDIGPAQPPQAPSLVRGVSDENLDSLAELGIFGYGLDPEIRGDQLTLTFNSAPYERRFRIELTYRAAGGVLQIPPYSVVLVPAVDPVTNPFTQIQVPIAGGSEVVSGTDFLWREFIKIPVGQAFSAVDPYEFKIYDPILGLVGFNPITASIPLPYQQGRGLTAKIDYDVDDWHVMRQNEVVPVEVVDASQGTTPMHALRLSTGPLKKLLEIEDNLNFTQAGEPTFEYQGLLRFYPDTPARPGLFGIDLVLVDLQTGYHIDSRTLQKPLPGNPPGVDNSNGEIDYDAGIIHLRETVTFLPPYNLAGGSPLQLRVGGRHVRVYYRSHNDLGVAPVMPYNRYILEANLADLGEREYTPYGPVHLLFVNADAEKTVSVDYTYVWQEPGNPQNEQIRSVVGELQRLQPPGSAGEPLPAAGHWWIGLGAQNEIGFLPGSIRVTGVRGTSFQTRVVWRDGKRWRKRERNTILTRELAR